MEEKYRNTNGEKKRKKKLGKLSDNISLSKKKIT